MQTLEEKFPEDYQLIENMKKADPKSYETANAAALEILKICTEKFSEMSTQDGFNFWILIQLYSYQHMVILSEIIKKKLDQK